MDTDSGSQGLPQALGVKSKFSEESLEVSEFWGEDREGQGPEHSQTG